MKKFMYVPVVRGEGDGFTSNPEKGWKDYTARYFNEGLNDVGDEDKLYIVGHGALSGLSLQSLTASSLFELLKAERLPASHKKFSLFSCYSGVKMPGASKSFAEAFAFAIRDYYQSASVVGYLGAVQFNRDSDDRQLATTASIAQWGGFGDQYPQSGSAVSQKVSFSIETNKYWFNDVRADQPESYVAAVQEVTEEASFMGEITVLNAHRVVVLDSVAAVGRPRSGRL